MTFLETSALTGENVEEVFLKTARSILTKIEAGIHICMICDRASENQPYISATKNHQFFVFALS